VQIVTLVNSARVGGCFEVNSRKGSPTHVTVAKFIDLAPAGWRMIRQTLIAAGDAAMS